MTTFVGPGPFKNRAAAEDGDLLGTALSFTLSAEPSATLTITAAGAADGDFTWDGPGGTFTGKAPAKENFEAGDWTVTSTKWDEVTALPWQGKAITALNMTSALDEMTALTSLNVQLNAGMTSDISGWTLPATLTNLQVGYTAVSGDISGWTLPAGLVTLDASSSSVSGNLAWTIPTTIASIGLANCSSLGTVNGLTFQATVGSNCSIDLGGSGASGDISGWSLPSGLRVLTLDNTAVSGNLAWTLPATMVLLSAPGTSSLGTISGLTFPASFNANCTVEFLSSSASGDISGWTMSTNLQQIRLQGTAVSGNLAWTLPAALTALHLNYCSSIGTINGITFPASIGADAQILFNNGSASGDISGWTLPTNIKYLSCASTSVSGDISSWTIPSTLTSITMDNTTVSGDISGWTIPTGFTLLSLAGCASIGSVAGITFPATAGTAARIDLSNSSASGDISDWTLSTNLRYLNLEEAYLLEGDISGWTLPAALYDVIITGSSVEGDLSGWSIPAGLRIFQVNGNSCSGDLSGYSWPSTMTKIDIRNNSFSGDIDDWTLTQTGLGTFNVSGCSGLTYDATGGCMSDIARTAATTYDWSSQQTPLSTDECDRILADCVTSTMDGNTLDISGNSVPTDGDSNSDRLTLVADGWTVTNDT